MKCLALAVSLVSVAILTVAASEASAAPILGIYKSNDIDGGVFLPGRWTEGYVGNNPNAVGNGAHAGSWNGAALYTQWELAGPTVASTVPISDVTSGDVRTQAFLRTFNTAGAAFTLQPGLWWTGPGDTVAYTVNLDFYEQNVTIISHGGVPLFANSVESFHGTFPAYAGHSLTGQGSGVFVNQGVISPPAGYPSWIPGTVVSGAWGNTGLIQIQIMPEPATLGLMGLGLVATILARRRRR